MEAGQSGKLGFGLMRLPRKGVKIDVERVSQMVDLFLGAGFTYFDTARIYPGSEAAAKAALVRRHPRESYTIATKMNTMTAPTARLAKRQFETSLGKLGVDYVDQYLLHSLMGANYKSYEVLGLWDYVRDLKRRGRVREIGFSFHAGPELLERLLREHPEVDFVQLQINYADWENPHITARANWQVAREHDVPIVVMEPVKGGGLADPPAPVRELMDAANPQASYASWALRFAAGLEGIRVVLSGMSNVQQVQDNVGFMREFRPLDEREREVIRQARLLLGDSSEVPCTACRYCTKGCPAGIDIPAVLAACNLKIAGGSDDEARAAYAAAVEGGGRASECIACGQCERACPQHIGIVAELANAAATFE